MKQADVPSIGPTQTFVLPPANQRSTRVNRRTFFAWPLSFTAAAALPSSAAYAQGCAASPPAYLVRGPLSGELPDILNTLDDAEVQNFLIGLDGPLQDLASLPLPEAPPFVQPSISQEESDNIRTTIAGVVEDLINTLPSDQRPGAQEIAAIVAAANDHVFGFLQADQPSVENLNTFVLPANFAAIPTLQLVGDSLIMADATETNLLVASPLCNVNQDPRQKAFDKTLIVGAMLLAMIAFVVALAGIKMPNVGADKIAPRLASLIKSAEFRSIFTTVVEAIKREGATVGEKVAAIFSLLKALWNTGALTDILTDVFTSLNFFDLAVTIASIAAIFLTAGTAVLAKAALALVGLIVAIAKGASDYNKAQQQGT
jgi:hypothetical protein